MATLGGWRLTRNVSRALLVGLFSTPAAVLVHFFILPLPRWVVLVCNAISLMCIAFMVAEDGDIWEREAGAKAQDETAK